MSVIPPLTVTNPSVVANGLYPSVAVDPINPLKVVEFQSTPVTLSTGAGMGLTGEYSTDGGQTWSNLGTILPMTDFATAGTNGLAPFAQMSSVSAAWDRLDNVYVVASEHSATGLSGRLVLQAFNFAGTGPVHTVSNSVIYSWNQQDVAYNPTIAIDSNNPSFIDPDSATLAPGLPPVTQTDTMANSLARPDLGPGFQEVPKALYVSWNTNVNSTNGFITGGGAANISSVLIAASDNGGQSFTTPEYITGESGQAGSPQASAPQLLFTQGTSALGYNNNQIGTPGGQLLAFYEQSTTWNAGKDVGLNNLVMSASSPDGGVASKAAAAGDTFTGVGGFIGDGIAPSGGGSNIPVETDFPISVNIADPNFGTLNDLSVTINAIDPTLNDAELILQPPGSSGLQPIILLANFTNPDGTTNKGIGLTSGVNLGMVSTTVSIGGTNVTFTNPVGTVFDSTVAVRSINDATAADPHVGYFQPEFGSLAQYDGATASQIDGTWTLRWIDNRSNGTTPPPTQYVDNWSLDFTSHISTTGFGTENAISKIYPGSVSNVYTTKLGAAGTPGMSPGYVVAIDNTLGAHSQYSGRIYVAYVAPGIQYVTTPAQPLNTDINLIYSDDLGQDWSFPETINDDGGATDGFSTGLRAQWMPSITVDQATGTVLVEYYDTRWDPTQLRSGNSVSASIDGGQTWSQSVYLNESDSAVDMITGNTVNLQPIPGNGPNAGTLGFGDRQGLAAWDGHLYAFFTSNLNATGTSVMTADVTYAAGPRVISGSEGAVNLSSVIPGEPAPQYAADGTRELTGFDITFDRPVFAPDFTPAEVTMLYRGPSTPLNQPGIPVAIGSITPIDPDWSGQMATEFFVQLLTPQSAVGTYSYAVGPNIDDRIWSAPLQDFNNEDQLLNGSFETPVNSTPGTAQFYASIPGWTLINGPNFDIQNSTYGPAADGQQWLELGDGTNKREVSQTIATIPGQAYELTFAFSPGPGTPANENDMAVNWNGKQVAFASGDGTGLMSTSWRTYTVTVVATSASSLLDFSSLLGLTDSNGLGNTELDDVTLVPINTTNLAFNGSFESPATTPGTAQTYAQIPGWQLLSGSTFDIQNNTYGVAADGTQWLELANTSDPSQVDSVYENIPTVPGKTYELTFDYSPAPGQSENEMVVSWGGTQIADVNQDGTGLAATDWQPFSFLLTATSTVTQLEFAGTAVDATGTGNTELDNVQLVQISDNQMDQNADGTSGEANLDEFAAPAPVNGVPFQLPYQSDSQPLIIPGPSVAPQTTNPATSGSFVPGQANTTTDNVVLNTSASVIDIRFDRQMNPKTFTPSAILSMTGPAGSIAGPFTVTPIYAAKGDTTTDLFQVGFPKQVVAGQYSITFAPTMTDTVVNASTGRESAVDTNQNAGLYTLQGNDPTSQAVITSSYQANSLSVKVASGQTVKTQISVPDKFVITQNQSNPIEVQLSILDSADPGLTVILIAPNGQQVQLFSGVGGFGSAGHANFDNTTFSDFATTPIQKGVPPFDTGPYNPQFPLSVLAGGGSFGKWTLELINTGSATATLTSWSVSLPHNQPGSGLGEPVADQFSVGFRIFVQSPTNALSSQVWNQVGPASENPDTGSNNGNNSGRVTGIAIDPSDPSGNIAYATGASGGVWKTTDFLTTSVNGPTWVPLTDLGPSLGMNIGGIAVFGRNGNPNNTIIIAGTGEGNTSTAGIGFLRSMDGGKTWQVLATLANNVDASGNVLPLNKQLPTGTAAGPTSTIPNFEDVSVYKVIVDPTPLPNGQVVIYAATSAGLFRSVNTGVTWTQLKAGSFTDVVLEPASKDANGNEQLLYAALPGQGIFYTTNATTATVLNQIAGQQGDVLRRDDDSIPYDSAAVPVANDTINTSQFTGRIALAVPALTGNPLADTLYEGWLYAAVTNPATGGFAGLFVTKDFGQNWTKVNLGISPLDLAPDNNNTVENVNVTGQQGSYDLAVAVDPTNPNILYLGGQAFNSASAGGMIRVDTTDVLDPYALVAYNNELNDGGLTRTATFQDNLAGINIKPVVPATTPPSPVSPWGIETFNSAFDGFNYPPSEPYLNLLRDPNNPFLAPSTSHYTGVAQFNNSGLGATWTYYTDILDGSADIHSIVTMKDPTTGLTRIIVGDDQGIFSSVDDGTGQLYQRTGTDAMPSDPRNGNLAILQAYDGAVQPSVLAAGISGSMFYAMAQDDGFPTSGSDPLLTGDLNWMGTPGDGTAVATDQTGSGTAYQYRWPCCINTPPLVNSDFFEIQYPNQNLTSRTTGLLQAGDNLSSNPNTGQWVTTPFGVAGDADIVVGNFAVNPIDPSAIVISSDKGSIFRTYGPTTGYGQQWFQISFPNDTDGSYAPALAFGAPDPNAGPNDLDNFIYAGTVDGNIYVTLNGGGQGGWKEIGSTANGLDGSTVMQIVTDPKRGSHDAFAVTEQGVYYLADATAAKPVWVKLNDTAGKGSLFNLTRGIFNNANNPYPSLTVITSIAVDWRYAIPNGSGGTSPVLYVGGYGGVFRSFDDGKTWNYYPDTKIDGAPQEGGYLPNVDVTSLSLSLGNINPTTGLPNESAGLNMLVATTYGRSTWAIKLDNAPFAKYLAIPVSAPKVSGLSAATTNYGRTLTGIQVTFSGPIDPETVSLAAILKLTGPNGQPIKIADFVDVTPNNADGSNDHNIWDIDFVTPTTVVGNYTLSLGTTISDYSGNRLVAFTGSLVFNSNRPPTISTPLDQLITPGTSSPPITITVGDPDTGANSVAVTATSSNETLIGDGSGKNPNDITISGTGATRTLIIKPTAGMDGSAIITLTATDPQGFPTVVSFTVYVDNVPVIAAIPDVTTGTANVLGTEYEQPISIPLQVSDADNNNLSFVAPSGAPLAIANVYDPNYDLEQKLGLWDPYGSGYLNNPNAWGDGKWLLSAINGQRYVITPDGGVHLYAVGDKTIADTTLIATLNPSVWTNPTLLTSDHSVQGLAANFSFTPVVSGSSTLTLSPPALFSGTLEVTITVSDGILPTPAFNLTPDFLSSNPSLPRETFLVTVENNRPLIAPIPDQTVPHGQTSLSVPVHIQAGNPNDTFTVGVGISGYSPNYELQEQLGLYEYVGPNGPTYMQNFYGENEKWLFSNVNGNRYLILPNGQVRQFIPGVTQNFAQTTYYTTVDPSVWANPALLTNAPAPLAPANIGGGLVGNNLQINWPSNYVGTFEVDVFATEGPETTQSFLVHVTDSRPTLQTIPDQTVTPGSGPIQVPLTAYDLDPGDTVTFNAPVISGTSQAYQLQQELGLYEYQGPSGASYFQSSTFANGKFLFSATTGQKFILMPNGNLDLYLPGAKGTYTTPTVAQLSSSYYANPTLLTHPATPAYPVSPSNLSPTASIDNATDTLTIDVPADYTGTFQVAVTVTDGALSATESFLVNVINGVVNQSPVLGAITDISTATDQEPIAPVTLSLTDADVPNPRVLTAITARSGPAYDLQQQLGLYAYQGASGPNYFQSAAFNNGKWLFSAVNGSRYLITSTGTVEQYVPGGTPNLVVVAQLDPSVYIDPTLITGAAPLPVGTTVSNTSLTLTPLPTLTGSFWTTVLATDGQFLTRQSFLTNISDSTPIVGLANGVNPPAPLPDQSIVHDGGSITVQLATADAAGDPVTLQTGLSNPKDGTVNLSGDQLTITPAAHFAGSFQVFVYASDGVRTTVQSFTVNVNDAKPSLSTMPNLTQTPVQALPQVTLDNADPDGDPVTVVTRVFGYTPAAQLQQELGLYDPYGPGYLNNPNAWGDAKWLLSATNGQRYLILPDGELREYTAGDTSVSQTQLVTTLSPSVWTTPTLLTNPVAPAVQLGLSGNTLTVTPPVGYFGSFWVDVMVTDGMRWSDQQFLVNATE